MSERVAFAFPELGVIRVRGADTVRYLQGQLSQDIERITLERSLLAGFHNVQGRTIALMRMIRIASDDVLAILPRELAPSVAPRLARFVLRAKVVIADESDRWRVEAVLGEPAQHWPRTLDATVAIEGAHIVCVGEQPPRWLVLEAGTADAGAAAPPEALARWRACEIAAGVPQVFAATSEAFVAQMLNLDLIGAIAFDKGCYTGQEIIARAHYRGRMKRRMQRFSASAPGSLSPGDRGRLPDGRAFTVVQAAHDGGSLEFLAVAALPGAQQESAAASEDSGQIVEAIEKPLPYEIRA